VQTVEALVRGPQAESAIEFLLLAMSIGRRNRRARGQHTLAINQDICSLSVSSQEDGICIKVLLCVSWSFLDRFHELYTVAVSRGAGRVDKKGLP
jgi:hypothetical protein